MLNAVLTGGIKGRYFGGEGLYEDQGICCMGLNWSISSAHYPSWTIKSTHSSELLLCAPNIQRSGGMQPCPGTLQIHPWANTLRHSRISSLSLTFSSLFLFFQACKMGLLQLLPGHFFWMDSSCHLGTCGSLQEPSLLQGQKPSSLLNSWDHEANSPSPPLKWGASWAQHLLSHPTCKYYYYYYNRYSELKIH